MWYTLEKGLKTRWLQRLERRAPSREIRPSDVDWAAIRRILIVRQHDQFGDFLLTTPAIYALRRRFPDAHLTLIIRDYLEPAGRRNPDVNEAAVFRESAWRWTPGALARFAASLLKGYDLAVVFNTVSHSLSSDLIAAGSRAPVILGPERPTFDHCAINPFYNLVSPVDPVEKHQIHRNLDVVRRIGADTADLRYRFVLTPEEESAGRAALQALLPVRTERVIGVHFGTKDIRKRYPISRLAEVCRRLERQDDTRLLVIPAPGEETALREFMTRMASPPACAPVLSLGQAAALFKCLDLLICNDTGVLHLAAAVDTPTVSFHALSDPAIWKPVGPYFIGLYAPGGDIDVIPVELTVNAAQWAINRKRRGATVSEQEVYTVR